MKHADIQQKLSAYLDGAVTPEERAIIEEHLKTCQVCSVALVELKTTVSHIKDLEELEPPAWMAQKIMARLKLEAKTETGFFRRLFFPLHIKLPLEAIALVLVTVTGYLVFRSAQPEMQLVNPPVREEYGREMPETPPASAPSEPSTKIDKSEKSKNEKALPLMPQETKPQLNAKEGQVPSTAPGLDSVGSSMNKSVSPAARMPEIIEKEEAKPVPAPQAERSMQLEERFAERAQSEMQGYSARKMKSMHEKPETSFSVTLFINESDADGNKVENEVERLGGRILKTEPLGNSRVLTIQLEGQKIRLLMERLRTLGKVTGRELVPGSAQKNTELTMQIEIRQESPQ